MALSGNTRELSLADLIVVNSQDPRNYRSSLSGPAGDGLLLIEEGQIVHAAYRAGFHGSVFLGRLGVGVSRVVVKERGTSEPVAPNDSLDGRRSNRRANVWILPER